MRVTILLSLFLYNSSPKIFNERTFKKLSGESIQKFLDRTIGKLNITDTPKMRPIVVDIFEQKKWERILLDNMIEKSRHKLLTTREHRLFQVNILFFQGKHNGLDVILMVGLYDKHFELKIGYLLIK